MKSLLVFQIDPPYLTFEVGLRFRQVEDTPTTTSSKPNHATRIELGFYRAPRKRLHTAVAFLV